MGALDTLTPHPRAPLVSRRRVLADLYIRAMSIRAGAARLVELEIARRLTKTTQRKRKHLSVFVDPASLCAFLHPRQLWIVACMHVCSMRGGHGMSNVDTLPQPARPALAMSLHSRSSGFHGGDGGPLPVVT